MSNRSGTYTEPALVHALVPGERGARTVKHELARFEHDHRFSKAQCQIHFLLAQHDGQLGAQLAGARTGSRR